MQEHLIDLLNVRYPNLNLQCEQFSGFMIKRLANDSSIAHQTNNPQAHISMSADTQDGASALFPVITNRYYLGEDLPNDETANQRKYYKRSWMVRINIQMYQENTNDMFQRADQHYNTLGFNFRTSQAGLQQFHQGMTNNGYTHTAYNRRVAAEQVQYEIGDVQMDTSSFTSFRRVILPNDYIVFLRHITDPCTYSFFGLPEDANLGDFLFQQRRTSIFGWLNRDDYFSEGHVLSDHRFVNKEGHWGREIPLEDIRMTTNFAQTRLCSNLYRLPNSFADIVLAAQPDLDPEYNPSSLGRAVRAIWTRIRRRNGQPRFRRDLLERYGETCQISGCTVVRVLQAAHIQPHGYGEGTNHVLNGLLLRSDIHTLYDRHLIRLEPQPNGGDIQIIVDDQLNGTIYDQYHQQNLNLNGTTGPSLAAIDWRNQELIQAYDEANVNLDD